MELEPGSGNLGGAVGDAVGSGPRTGVGLGEESALRADAAVGALVPMGAAADEMDEDGGVGDATSVGNVAKVGAAGAEVSGPKGVGKFGMQPADAG